MQVSQFISSHRAVKIRMSKTDTCDVGRSDQTSCQDATSKVGYNMKRPRGVGPEPLDTPHKVPLPSFNPPRSLSSRRKPAMDPRLQVLTSPILLEHIFTSIFKGTDELLVLFHKGLRESSPPAPEYHLAPGQYHQA